MVTDVYYSKDFENDFKKADNTVQKRIIKQIEKIIKNPEVGKTMMYSRAGTREVYIKPFRLSYKYDLKNDDIVILKLYHKDQQ